MNKKVVQIFIFLLVGITLVAARPLPSLDDGDDGGAKAYCVMTMYNPVGWGDAVRGYGKVQCSSVTGYITIVYELIDQQNSSNYKKVTKTCNNATFCDVAVYINLKSNSGHYFKSKMSHYSPSQSTYDESPWIQIFHVD